MLPILNAGSSRQRGVILPVTEVSGEVSRGNLFRFDSHVKANLVLGFLHQPSDPDYD